MGLRERLNGKGASSAALRDALRGTGALDVPCRLRRTSPRGWGPWTEGTVHLGVGPGGGARWSAADAVAVGFASINDGVDLPFDDVDDVVLRPVRFRTEAFWGMDNDIVLVTSDGATVEVAVPPGCAEPLAGRLVELLVPPSR